MEKRGGGEKTTKLIFSLHMGNKMSGVGGESGKERLGGKKGKRLE